MKDKKVIIAGGLIIVLAILVIIHFRRPSQNKTIFVPVKSIIFIPDNKKYDSLKLEYDKAIKTINVISKRNEKIRDTVYFLDERNTDSLQRELLRFYQNNKGKLSPKRFSAL